MDLVEQTEMAPRSARLAEVFKVFLRLGLTSFGGPVAHLGYFREQLVSRRKWLDEQAYADIVALCQFLPGPASSQVGFAVGLLRGGFLGGVAAWVAFTLPSAALLLVFASFAGSLSGPIGNGLLHGLKLMAVAVVAQAISGMAQKLTPDAKRATIALVAVFVVAIAPPAAGQIIAIALGSALGVTLCRDHQTDERPNLKFNISLRVGLGCLASFVILLVLPPIITFGGGFQGLSLFDAFYRSGALVFGGGHVVLPLLQARVVDTGWVGHDLFLAGYGAAQAVPGPLFAISAYLGAIMPFEPNGIIGAAIALFAIFLPGFLILVGVLPFWNRVRGSMLAQAAMRGTNAAVVGILAAALYDPLWVSAVFEPLDFAAALTGAVLLITWKASPLLVVILMGTYGIAHASS